MIVDKKLSETFDFSWIDMEGWKKNAGEIPPPTCPEIDKAIKDNGKNIDRLMDIEKLTKRRYDDVEELSSEISYCIDYDEIDLEPLRDQNQQLRGLGEFWYDRCCEIVEKLKEYGFMKESEDA